MPSVTFLPSLTIPTLISPPLASIFHPFSKACITYNVRKYCEPISKIHIFFDWAFQYPALTVEYILIGCVKQEDQISSSTKSSISSTPIPSSHTEVITFLSSALNPYDPKIVVIASFGFTSISQCTYNCSSLALDTGLFSCLPFPAGAITGESTANQPCTPKLDTICISMIFWVFRLIFSLMFFTKSGAQTVKELSLPLAMVLGSKGSFPVYLRLESLTAQQLKRKQPAELNNTLKILDYSLTILESEKRRDSNFPTQSLRLLLTLLDTWQPASFFLTTFSSTGSLETCASACSTLCFTLDICCSISLISLWVLASFSCTILLIFSRSVSSFYNLEFPFSLLESTQFDRIFFYFCSLGRELSDRSVLRLSNLGKRVS